MIIFQSFPTELSTQFNEEAFKTRMEDGTALRSSLLLAMPLISSFFFISKY